VSNIADIAVITPLKLIELSRDTRETRIRLQLNIDGARNVQIDTGLPFFNHLLEQLAFHAGWDLQLQARGDIEIDDHHLIEDVAIVLGTALDQLRQTRPGLTRYGQRLLPMDETLVLCAVDLSGRAASVIDLPFTREAIGGIATEMWPHFFKTLASKGQFALHLKTQYFDNHHHLIEASFKAMARALKEALAMQGDNVTSTKGVL
jgi:imidazoleglycerol phosphate dehydratase HisB